MPKLLSKGEICDPELKTCLKLDYLFGFTIACDANAYVSIGTCLVTLVKVSYNIARI